MANLSNDDIRHLAALSKIAITSNEEQAYAAQLSSILEYVEQLDKIDTDGLAPTSQVTGLSSVSRDDDDTSDTMATSQLLNQAPNSDGQNIKVPKVL